MNANKLRGKIREKAMSICDVAKSINISTSSLHRKISGDTEFTRSEIEGISSLLELSNDEILAIFFA